MADRCLECLQGVRQNPRALIALKVYTLVSGLLLATAGLVGLILVLRAPFEMVISIYAMLFGFTVVVVEHGTWLDNVSFLKRFYALLDAEFHMLASQRGKGFFYSGAGVLTLFTDGKTISFTGAASICLIVAGVLHTFRIVHEDPINAQAHPEQQPAKGGAPKDTSVPPPASNYVPVTMPASVPEDLPPPPPPISGAAATSEWNSIVASQSEREGGQDWGAGTAREERTDYV